VLRAVGKEENKRPLPLLEKLGCPFRPISGHAKVKMIGRLVSLPRSLFGLPCRRESFALQQRDSFRGTAEMK
jgi:hypothetical protein